MSDSKIRSLLRKVAGAILNLFSTIREKAPGPLDNGFLSRLHLTVILFTEPKETHHDFHVWFESTDEGMDFGRVALDMARLETEQKCDAATVDEGPLAQPIHYN